MMRSKIIALTKKEEFKNLIKKKWCQINMLLFFGSLKGKDINKLNISFVTKKIGNAVKRNKIKRRLRNIMNDASKNIKVKLKYSYLVIAKPTILENKYSDIKRVLFQEFKRIK